MKTRYIIPALLFFGLSFGASAQSKTGTDTTTNRSSDTYVQPYSVEEPETGEDYLFEIDKESTSPEIMGSEGSSAPAIESESDVMETETESTLENAATTTGNAVKSGASKVGSEVKSGGKAVGKGAKKGGKAVGKGAKKAGNAVESGAKEGWKETKQHTPGTDAREKHKSGELD